MNRYFVFAMAAVVALAMAPRAGAADDQAKLAKEAKISKEKAREIALAPGSNRPHEEVSGDRVDRTCSTRAD